MKLPAYPKYKDSGVEWLGDVPEHWEVLALKRKFHVVNGATPSSTEDTYWEGEIPWFTPEDLGRNESKVIVSSRRQITEEGLANCGTNLTPTGSVLVSTRAPIGHVALTGVDGCCNQGCRMLVPTKSVSSDFYYYFVLASKEVLQSVGKGTTFLELSAGSLGSHQAPLPPIAEQQAIAEFLDRETGRIDRLVAKKRELIERLKEKRTALISRTVTRGLPPAAARAAGLPENPPLKPSGLDWLGDIPAYWEVMPLKFFAYVKTGFAFSSDDFTDEGVPVLRIGDINRDGRIDFSDAKYLPTEYLRRHSDVIVRLADIAMAMTGATIGKVGRYHYETPALLNQRVCLFRPQPGKSQDYLWYLLNSDFYIEHVVLTAFGGAQPNISDRQLLSCIVPVPPLPEQAAIASYLDAETAKLDALVTKVETAIERLQEYRTALITAAVTGKIDVRKEVTG